MALGKIKEGQYTVIGDDNVIKNMNRAIKKIRGNTRLGVNAATEFVKGEAQEITPVDKGILINSAFAKLGGSLLKIFGVAGFTTKYAAAVHEMPKSTNWKKPGAENEFLEKAVIRNVSSIINLIKRFAGKKPI